MAGAVTRFERLMEKALSDNTDAMFKVELGDAHRHAYVKGVHKGLSDALATFRKDFQTDPDGDGF